MLGGELVVAGGRPVGGGGGSSAPHTVSLGALIQPRRLHPRTLPCVQCGRCVRVSARVRVFVYVCVCVRLYAHACVCERACASVCWCVASHSEPTVCRTLFST